MSTSEGKDGKDPGVSPNSDPKAKPQASEDAQGSLAPMDFSTFAMSLGSSAMVNLGKIAPPGGQKLDVDLAAAKQIIDILGMLEEKTKGNLDDSEQKLLKSLLFDLRVHFVDAQKKSQ